MEAIYKAFSGTLLRCLYSDCQSRGEKNQTVLKSLFVAPAEETIRATKSSLSIVLIVVTSDWCMKEVIFPVNLEQSK